MAADTLRTLSGHQKICLYKVTIQETSHLYLLNICFYLQLSASKLIKQMGQCPISNRIWVPDWAVTQRKPRTMREPCISVSYLMYLCRNLEAAVFQNRFVCLADTQSVRITVSFKARGRCSGSDKMQCMCQARWLPPVQSLRLGQFTPVLSPALAEAVIEVRNTALELLVT